MRSQTTSYTTSSRYDPPARDPPSTIFPSRRFGTSSYCPGCNEAVGQMERGVVPGPQGSRWHATCLVCGGKEAKGRRKAEGKPGCGKKLDSAAKTDAVGNVWCRECLVSSASLVRRKLVVDESPSFSYPQPNDKPPRCGLLCSPAPQAIAASYLRSQIARVWQHR